VSENLLWERDGLDWPHRDKSRFIQAAGLRWHVQQFGTQAAPLPVALLIHGTAASTHSWRGLAPLLAPCFNVFSLDLPGHGFTGMPAGRSESQQFSLAGMAGAIGTLLLTCDLKPALVVGHSAGAAIALRMCLDKAVSPQLVIGLNGAFLPLGGLAGQLFAPAAKVMAATRLVPRLFSWRATEPDVLRKLIDNTGSMLDASGIALYGKLVGNPSHAAGALAMMANWDLSAFLRDIPQLRTQVCLMVGANDRTIPPRQAIRFLAKLPHAACSDLITLPGLGHLAHEEDPQLIAREALKQFTSSNGAHVSGG
jgi:magnesium chelatase accessory protein